MNYFLANVPASSTEYQLIQANSSFGVKILAAILSAGSTATTIVFNTGSTPISPTITCPANSPVILPITDQGWFERSNPSDNLTITTGAGSTVGIQLIWTYA